jgi:hypothetical protein
MFHGDKTVLLPASYLHASLRASNGLYNKDVSEGAVAGLLVGSRFRRNKKDGDFVDTAICYPLDAGSDKRRNMLTTMLGNGCHPGGPKPGICINDTCLATRAQECACNYKDVPAHMAGEFFAKYLKTAPKIVRQDKRISWPSRFSCWYDNDHLSDMIVASNSFWKERTRWTHKNESEYPGWTECAVTMNMRDKAMVDAIVVQLPVRQDHYTSLCEYGKDVQNDVLKELQLMFEYGFQHIPVVFLEQVRGMSDHTECNLVWNGRDCEDGYRKEIFAQEFNFTDGSCLAIPDGCKDVYFFPVSNTASTCHISSDVCIQQENISPHHASLAKS